MILGYLYCLLMASHKIHAPVLLDFVFTERPSAGSSHAGGDRSAVL